MATVTINDPAETGTPITLTVVAQDVIEYVSRSSFHSILGRNSVIAQAGPQLPQRGTLTLHIPDKDAYVALVGLVRDNACQLLVRSDEDSGVYLNAIIIVTSYRFSPWIEGNPARFCTFNYQQVDDAPEESS